jgi:hypothetical protein
MFDVTTYGAVGDGANDDRPAIQDAIDAAEVSGGVVYFPKGIYLLDSSTVSGLCLTVEANDVFLRGDGRGVSVLKVGDGQNAACVNFQYMTGGGISGLEIDGNRANQAGGHGVRSGGGLVGWLCRDMYIHDTFSYGIGLQFNTPAGDSSYTDCVLEDIVIENTGLDGIDVKNHDNTNSNNKMSNVTVRRAGLRTDVAGQACVDIRGPWELNNISCFDFSDGETTNCQSGIRFRPGETSDSSGVGGHYSSLTNFHVEAGSTTTETVGLHIQSYNVTVSSGVVRNTKTGVGVDQREVTIGNVYVDGCVNGYMIEDGESLTNGDRVCLIGCIARGATDSGFRIYTDHCNLIGIQARSCVTGVNLRSGSVMTVIGGVASSNTNNFVKQSAGITWKDAGFVY